MRYICRATGKKLIFTDKAKYEAHLQKLREEGILVKDRSRKARPDISRNSGCIKNPLKRFSRPDVVLPKGQVRQRFSLIHPSWGRPVMARQCIRMWQDLCSDHNDLEYILSLDSADARNYLPIIRDLTTQLNLRVVMYDNESMVGALNKGALLASGDVLIYVSDDFECPPNWDVQIQKAVGKKKNWALFVYDGKRKDLQTISIVSRRFYEDAGYMYYPKYKSMWADNDYTERAKRMGKVIDMRSTLTFKHNHFTSGASFDATYQKQNRPEAWSHGEKLFHKRAAENFGVKK